MKFSFSCKNKWGTRITPTVQWPDKSFTMGLAQALAWKRSGLMVRPTIQFSVCPTFGGSNLGLQAELIHSVNEELSLICGYAFMSHPFAFASLSWLKRRQAHLLRAQQGIPVSKYGVLVDMIHVSNWAFEAAGQEMRGMGQDAAYQPGLYLTATQVSIAFWYLEWHLDVLILWALASTGAFDKGEDLLKGLRFRISKMSKKQQQAMQSGMLLAEAVYEYGKGNYKEALELLGPDFEANNFKTIGASDEQLDVFNEVWYVMLLNTGQAIEAIEVIGKLIKMREGAPFMWRLLERGYANGREAGSYCWRAFIAATMDERRNASFRILDECSTSPHVESHVHSFGRNIGLIDLRFVVILFGCLKSYFRD